MPTELPIEFGTDGWRAVIADEYTFQNVERVTRATARWIEREYGADRPVVLAHDARFQGRAFAERAAQVLAAEGLRVLFGEGFTTTPAVSWAAREFEAAGGVVITASHNPPEYNGFKIKAEFGGPATPDMISEVEQELADLSREDDAPLVPFEQLVEEKVVDVRDVTGAYLDAIRSRIDIEAIREADLRVAHDAMFGAGQGLFTRLLGEEHVVELHSEYNPGFQRRAPEPIARQTEELADAVVDEGCDAGIANDGDADRIGMYNEQGLFVNSHQMLALLLKYLHEERGMTGDVVKTFSTTHMLDKMGEKYGLTVHTTPIGFKYIGPKMVDSDVLVGGEESGGMAVKDHIPERDGLYIGLLILEMMAKRGKSLSALVEELFEEFGQHLFYRADLRVPAERKAAILEQLETDAPAELNGHTVEEVETLDGFKHRMSEGWLLIRPSGTEPVLRVYAEAETAEAAKALVDDAVRQLGIEAATAH